MKRPLSDYRPFGPFFGSFESLEESRTGGHIIMEFISSDHDQSVIEEIQDDILMFSEIEKKADYPNGRTSIVVNTNLNRLSIEQIVEIHTIFNPTGDDLIKLSAKPTIDHPDDDIILAQNDLIIMLDQKIQKRKLSKQVTQEIGTTSIDVYNPDNIVEASVSYASMFKITEPDTLSEVVGVYQAINGEFEVERMFLQPFMY
jgi:hypothetical protein